ncbi:hypothetical protein CASFOL_025869 [Castilleja foliolosa]|uniref:Uncharacterized protein n=1 Tax=Castilleja foliolosa TaxID=1961234 RepID=A0ABD3CSC9_9LAMI
MSNSMQEFLTRRERQKEKNVDVLIIASEATIAQGWIVDGGDDNAVLDLTRENVEEELSVDGNFEHRRSSRIQETRELHENDFISDDVEEIDDMNLDFLSDSKRVLEGYGEEEEEEFDA